MPPKKAPAGPSKKTDEKKKAKIIEDKTFGLKNKKGAKQQRFIQQVNHQVKTGNNPKAAKPLEDALTKKEQKKKEQAEMNLLFKPVAATQKVEQGVDPKSVLCAFFKQGQCTKGDKCKFSHDLTIERKAEKKSLYFDERGEKTEDTMENWDEDKLAEVVAKKHGEREKALPPTSIICKHFLDAIENNKYGWFWECPNGGLKCHYRHALPPGFVLKKDQKKREKGEEITIEELVEIERSKLGSNLTKITLDSFLAWKKKKIAEKQKKEREDMDKKKAQYRAGKSSGLSGREMFTFNPELALDSEMDDGEAAMDIIREKDEDDDVVVKEIDLNAMAQMATEADASGTQVDTAKRDFGDVRELPSSSTNGEPSTSVAASGSDQPDGDTINEPIDESLFADDALDGLEDELDGVEI